jgi:hypothetical protein
MLAAFFRQLKASNKAKCLDTFIRHYTGPRSIIIAFTSTLHSSTTVAVVIGVLYDFHYCSFE